MVAMTRSMAVVGSVAVLASGGLLFAQPTTNSRISAPVHQVGEARNLRMAETLLGAVEAENHDAGALSAILAGLMLGVVVGFAGAANAITGPFGKPSAIDDNPNIKAMYDFSKKKAETGMTRQFTKKQDAKYTKSPTGQGRYHKFG